METSHAPQVVQGLASLVERSTDEGKQGDLACLLDCGCDNALVAGAGAGLAAWADLSILGDVAAEQVRLFVIDCQGFICTELAGFGLCKEAAFSAGFLSRLGSSIFSHYYSNFVAIEIQHARHAGKV
jgi:hypothetical protein